MFILDLLFALSIALILTLVFFGVFRNRAPWIYFVAFFVIVFLASWAGGLWIIPFGPTMFSVTWLPFSLAGLFFALLLVGAAANRPTTYQHETVEQRETKGAVSLIFIISFWILVIGLVVAIILGYLSDVSRPLSI